MNELVSVIITTYKGSKKLQRAIDSVINQSYKFTEIIIIDDNNPNSNERLFTEKLMIRYKDCNKVHYIKHSHNMNGAVARNTGIATAKGTYIAFLDDDDYFLPNRIEVCVNALTFNPEMIAVYTDSVLMCNGEIVARNIAKKEPACKDVLLNQNLLGTGSNLFILKAYVDAINGFDARFIRYQDVEFIMRILKKGAMIAVNEVTVVKDIEEIRFMPAYKRLYEMQNLFISVFRSDIDSLTDKQKWVYFSTKMNDLFEAAYESNDKQNVNQVKCYLRDNYRKKILFEIKMKIKYRIKNRVPFIYEVVFKGNRNKSLVKLTDSEKKAVQDYY